MRLLLLLALALIGLQSFGSDIELMRADTTDPGIFKQGSIPAKMLAARHEFLENNIRGALTIYREVLQIEPENASALYRTAECHYQLKKYDLAYEYLNDALALDDNVSKEKDFFRGQIYHRLSDLDKAIASFEAYLATDPGKRTLEFELCTEFIEQCQYAKEMMANPANVKIKNLGRSINTRYDDYTPSVTADGQLLVFTSRRSDTEGGEIDEGNDYKFFEDVYYSKWNDEDEDWEQAEGLKGEVNTPGYDAVLSIAPGGDELFIYKNNISSAGDIFTSSYNKAGDDWRLPVKMDKPINTSYFEASVSITEDGSTLYFISERPGGLGQGDIYVSKKKGGEWGKPENLGKEINTELDEKFVFIHPNGRTLFLASNGHQTMGSYDIFKSEFINGRWSVPVNLGYPINTVNEESTFSLTSDNKTLFIAAEYEDTYGERDIYKVDVSEYTLLSEGYDRNNFGVLICSITIDGSPAKNTMVKVLDPQTDRVVTEGEADRAGQVKMNLQAGKKYMVSVETKSGKKEELIELAPRAGEPMVVKLEFKF